jgi:hypothetical protein
MAPRMPRVRAAALATLFAAATLATASSAMYAVDEAAALDDQALGALRSMDTASAPPPVAPPTDAMDEVAAWFAPELVDRLKGAMVRVQPAGR